LCNSWDWDKRPMPRNAHFARFDRINPKEFDAAILHFDENVQHPEMCQGQVPPDWGVTFRWFLDNIPLPKVAVCHGTPQFAGQYNVDYKEPDLGTVDESSRRELVNLLGDILVVCNSHQAKREWGFRNSTVVWHGFAPHEYPSGNRDQEVLTMLHAALCNRPHYNGLFVFEKVKELLNGAMTIDTLKVLRPLDTYQVDTSEWAEAKFRNYAREIGRYTMYLNPTLRSPMPRSRGEAMMAGLVTVSMHNHDVDLFVQNGVNGFYADSAEEMAEQLKYLKRNPLSLSKMGSASRETALDLFNQDRYLAAWGKILHDIAG
jgi:glycosyltransferase involved in cell wall biosynthesis